MNKMGGGGFEIKMLNYKKTIAIIVAIIFVLLLFIWLKPTPINAYKVKSQEFVPSLLLSGEVIAHGSTVLSATVSGKVLECPTAKGEQVAKGQLLVQLDDAQAQLEHDRAGLALEIAQAKLQQASTVTQGEARTKNVQAELEAERASAQYSRLKTLFDCGAVSLIDLEEAQRQLRLSQEAAVAARTHLESLAAHGSAITVLQTELKQRQLDLQEKEIILHEHKILAPAAGQLLDLYVKPGEMLTNGSHAALIATEQGLRIKIRPDQRYAALTALGNQAKVWIANEETVKWDAQVVFTDPSGDAEQGSFTAELEFSSTPTDLYPGQLLSVQLFAPTQANAVILPDCYLTEQAGHSGVWLAVENRAHFTMVQLGLRTENGVIITDGLRDGDMVLEPAKMKENKSISARKIRIKS